MSDRTHAGGEVSGSASDGVSSAAGGAAPVLIQALRDNLERAQREVAARDECWETLVTFIRSDEPLVVRWLRDDGAAHDQIVTVFRRQLIRSFDGVRQRHCSAAIWLLRSLNGASSNALVLATLKQLGNDAADLSSMSAVLDHPHDESLPDAQIAIARQAGTFLGAIAPCIDAVMRRAQNPIWEQSAFASEGLRSLRAEPGFASALLFGLVTLSTDPNYNGAGLHKALKELALSPGPFPRWQREILLALCEQLKPVGWFKRFRRRQLMKRICRA